MDREIANEILACLPRGRSRFHYFKDRYALQLLGYAAGSGKAIEQLRRSPYARLLNKPAVKALLAQCGDGIVDRQRTDTCWRKGQLPFLLTVGLWGDKQWDSYNQTSRPGYNLVLRLNFCQEHDRRFQQMFAPYYEMESLNWYSGHPTLKQGERRYFRQTLAWARLDVDMERGEALIEEIQTDWVREANDERKELAKSCDNHKERRAIRYLNEVLQPYAAVWDEAMLSAAIYFLREELGIARIWYHSWHSGNALKGIGNDWAPPRSLYQRLPRQFCFREVEALPPMLHLRSCKKRLSRAGLAPRFYQLQL